MNALPFVMRWLARILFAWLGTLGSASTGPIVQLDSGRIEGVLLDEAAGLRVFRGIPYAAAPIGQRRWRAPEAVTPWEGVRAAREFGPACPQSPLIAYLSGETLPATSEDCLTLNVWSAARADERRPVLVWIHGGGFVGGWAHQTLYDGAVFARRGLVFVSLNYRLGPLGFLSLPELAAESAGDPTASGNFGFLDQIAALRWVRANIAAFGGDPERVTLVGESAGATSVLALCASPVARGLFCGAIAQSAWLRDELFVPRTRAEAKGRALASSWLGSGDTVSLADLRALPADELWRRAGASFEPALALGGPELLEAPEDAFAAGRQARVPLLAGTTADEGSVFRSLVPAGTPEAYEAWLDAEFGPLAADVRELYPATSAAEVSAALARLITDRWFLRGTRATLRANASARLGTWQYLFARADALQPSLGAHHAVELPYLFDALGPDAPADARAVSGEMIAAWVRFAETGDPNGAGPFAWPRFEDEREACLVFGKSLEIREHVRADACDVLDGIRSDARER